MKRCVKCNSLMPDDEHECIKCHHVSLPPPAVVRTVAAPPVAAEPSLAAVPPLPSFAPGERPGRFRASWLIAKQSWRVLMQDKSLLVFPLLSGFSCLLVIVTFLSGAFFARLYQGQSTGDEAFSWVVLFVYYFVNFFVIVFFNSALVSCAMTRFQGGIPTVGEGLRAATVRLPQILAWSLLAATVGVLLRMLQERFEFLGRLVIAMLGAAWAIATYFIVPVLVMERAGPLDAVKRSVSLMKQTWGESLISHVGLGAVTGLIGLLGVMLIAVISCALAMVTSSLGALIAGFVAIAAFVVLVALVSSALSSIVLTALYLYAAQRKMPQAFEGMEQFAFAPK